MVARGVQNNKNTATGVQEARGEGVGGRGSREVHGRGHGLAAAIGVQGRKSQQEVRGMFHCFNEFSFFIFSTTWIQEFEGCFIVLYSNESSQ